MNKFIVLFIIAISLIIFAIGFILNNMILIVTGLTLTILILFYIYKKQTKEGKEKFISEYLDYPEKRRIPIISSSRPAKKKRKKVFFLILISIVSILIFGMALYLLGNTLYGIQSYITTKSYTDKACARLNSLGCNRDPSAIFVPFDVNGDGIEGGVNDTLTNFFEKQGCFNSTCIKRRCGCPGY